jgi:hypothetical protein
MSVLLPEGMRPTNLHLTPFYKNEDGVWIINKARLVTADMFMICQRVREISPGSTSWSWSRILARGRSSATP